jgi:Cytochrome C'
MPLRSRHLWLLPVLIAIAVAATLLLLPSRRLRPDRHLSSPEHIPEIVRRALHQRMERHGNDMVDLSWSVVLLKYDVVTSLANRIGNEAPLARSLGDVETPVNAALPARFFDLQDQLIAETKRLAEAAQGGDPDRLATAYSAVTRTCVSCHALYLTAPAVPPGR